MPSLADIWNIPVAYRFEVIIGGATDFIECSFSEVSGLNVTIHYEKQTELGAHDYDILLPKSATYTNLVLKRGLLRQASLTGWFNQTLKFENLTYKDVVINLLGGDSGSSVPLVSWSIKNAYPISMKISPFSSNKSELVIEEIELKYETFTRQDYGTNLAQ